MMDSLKQARKNISRGFSRTLEHIAEGWRELVHRSSDALTHFTHSKHEVSGGQRTSIPLFQTGACLRERSRKRTKRLWCE